MMGQVGPDKVLRYTLNGRRGITERQPFFISSTAMRQSGTSHVDHRVEKLLPANRTAGFGR